MVYTRRTRRRGLSPRLMAFVAGIIAALLLLTFWQLYYQARQEKDAIIADTVVELAQIFKQIDAKCKIIGFNYDKTIIDFLNVGQFSGSEVGSMNLAYPQKWQGPYLKENPHVQNKFYQIVRTAYGYFIVPGDGVRLGNGKVIGKDLIFTKKTNIRAMMQDPQALLDKDTGRALAAELIFAPTAADLATTLDVE